MAALIQFKDGVDGVCLRLERQVTRVGRGQDNDIVLHDELVSQRHATIEAEGGEAEAGFHYHIKDSGSTNGTFVNGELVELCRLRHDDVIRLGISHFRFVDDANDDLAATTKIQKTWIPGVYFTKRRPKEK